MSEELNVQASSVNQAVNFFKLGRNSLKEEKPLQYNAVSRDITFSSLPAPELNYASPETENLHSDGDF